MNDEQRLAELEVKARHASDRYRLYRASAHGPRPTHPARLRELRRESELAERLLARFKADRS
jgi:hypothetical protein